jgi:hypothetical protein
VWGSNSPKQKSTPRSDLGESWLRAKKRVFGGQRKNPLRAFEQSCKFKMFNILI